MEKIRPNEVELKDVLGRIEMQYKVGDRSSILLLGGVGIGKSEGCKQVANRIANHTDKMFVEYTDDWARDFLRKVEEEARNEEGDGYIDKARKTNTAKNVFVYKDLRLTDCEPTDLLGIPRDDVSDSVSFKPLLWARVLSISSGMLMLDELTNVQRQDVQAAMLKLLLDKRAGDVEFHPDVLVLAAGNRPDDSSIAVELPAPTIDRMYVYDVVGATLDDWGDYMNNNYGDDWDKRVFAYLKSNPSMMHRPPQDGETLDKFPTRRGWTNLSLILKHLGSDFEAIKQVSSARVGSDAGSNIAAFLKTKVEDIETLVEHPEKWEGHQLDAKYLMGIQLGAAIGESIRNGEGIDKYRNLLTWLKDNDGDSFMLLVVMFIEREQRVKFFNKMADMDITLVNALKSVFKEGISA